MEGKKVTLSVLLLAYFAIGFLGANVISEKVLENDVVYQDDQDEVFDRNLETEMNLRSAEISNQDEYYGHRMAKQMNPNYTMLRSGVGCGYLRMKTGQVYTIQSSNFKVGQYFNNEACVWRFFGHHCIVAAQCPCSDIPQSASCLKDYLKIADEFLFNQRFCGDLKPSGAYTSATNNLRIRFRSDAKETATGFICYVYCSAPGQAEYIVPTNATCPTPATAI